MTISDLRAFCRAHAAEPGAGCEGAASADVRGSGVDRCGGRGVSPVHPGPDARRPEQPRRRHGRVPQGVAESAAVGRAARGTGRAARQVGQAERSGDRGTPGHRDRAVQPGSESHARVRAGRSRGLRRPIPRARPRWPAMRFRSSSWRSPIASSIPARSSRSGACTSLAGQYTKGIEVLHNFLLDQPGYPDAIVLLAEAYDARAPDRRSRSRCWKSRRATCRACRSCRTSWAICISR